jgi:hypothetical protein
MTPIRLAALTDAPLTSIPVQIVLLLFGLVNGGVLMRGFGDGTWAVLMAALVGRPVGIAAGTSLGLAAGLHPPRVAWRDIVLVAIIASTSFSFGLFFASAIFPVGSLLIQTRMGAMVTLAGAVIAFGAARALHVGRFAVAGADVRHHLPGAVRAAVSPAHSKGKS